MSTLHAAPARDVFDIHKSASLQPSLARPSRHQDEDRGGTDSDAPGDRRREESDNEEEEDVDDSVKEDMKRLEDTFPGISDHFRLVNRIGEGMVTLDTLVLHAFSPFNNRDFLHGLQSRRSII
jgi:cell division control protein 7